MTRTRALLPLLGALWALHCSSEKGATPAASLSPIDAGTLLSQDLPLSGRVLLRALPTRADAPLRIAEPKSGVSISVRPLDAAPVAAVHLARRTKFPNAHALGGGIELRESDKRVEDFVEIPARPANASIRYGVSISGKAAGLRLVDDVLEVVDAGGAPRLRAERPYVAGADGKRAQAHVSVEGCAIDNNPAMPWGRAPVAAGANECVMSVRWDAGAVAYPAVVDPAWTVTSEGAPKKQATVLQLVQSSRVGIAGGLDASGAITSSAEVFDLATRTYATAAAMPTARARATAIPSFPTATSVVDYVIGGVVDAAGTTTTANESFDGTSWTTQSPLPIAAADWSAATKVAAAGVVVIVGGDPKSGLSGAWKASLTPSLGTWVSIGTGLDSPRIGAAAYEFPASAGDSYLFVGGRDLSGTALKSTRIYVDAASPSWVSGPAMSSARADAAWAVLSGKLLLMAGGSDGAAELSTAEVYDPTAGTTGAWSSVRSLGGPRSHAGAAAGLIAGGERAGAALSDAELFDASTGAPLGLTTSMAAPHDGSQLALLSTPSPTRGWLVIGGPSPAELWVPTNPGGSCATDADCAGQPCIAATCCKSKCTAGFACDSTGTCATHCGASGDLPCLTGFYCDPTNTCVAQLPNGTKATAASQCVSSHLADGVCCDSDCTGVCQACDGRTAGTCAPVTGAPHHGTCAAPGADPCSQPVCNGTATDKCAGFVGSSVSCRNASCASGKQTLAASCDGSGACPSAVTTDCGNYACDGATCRKTCRADGDCVAPATCDPVAHTCGLATVCTDNHTQQTARGTQDCTPFLCSGGACLRSCTSSEQCVAGFQCTGGICGTPPKTNNSSGGGCTVERGVAQGLGSQALVLLGAALSMVVRRRRARA